MSDRSRSDADCSVIRPVVVLLVIIVIVRLTPHVLQLAWAVVPNILMMVIIVGSVHGMVKRLLG
jgi:hypothetical protein